MTPLSWNRIPRVTPARTLRVDSRRAALPATPPSLLAWGNGRSYSDVCLNEGGTLLLTRGLDRFIAFDTERGVLRCEAGVLLGEILELVVPRGWFLPVTPGTRFVTVGGAIANDVHGKNHAGAGTFGCHLQAIELRRSDGEVLELRADEPDPARRERFAATIGGLGLTGLITAAELQLQPVAGEWMEVDEQRFTDLDGFDACDAAASRPDADWPYTVAWVDCIGAGRGRGIFSAARHAANPPARPAPAAREKNMPVDPPFSLVNGPGLRIFNALYYRRRLTTGGQPVHYRPFFYPLDAIRNWNRIYGRRGFYQYQCVLPPEHACDGVRALLERIAAAGEGSFLAVLKRFGSRPSPGLLSFPRPGLTLALDFPARGTSTLRLLESLDTVVREAGGALYPAKDTRLPADLFRSGFPQWERFATHIDPAFSSSFWRRMEVS